MLAHESVPIDQHKAGRAAHLVSLHGMRDRARRIRLIERDWKLQAIFVDEGLESSRDSSSGRSVLNQVCTSSSGACVDVVMKSARASGCAYFVPEAGINYKGQMQVQTSGAKFLRIRLR